MVNLNLVKSKYVEGSNDDAGADESWDMGMMKICSFINYSLGPINF